MVILRGYDPGLAHFGFASLALHARGEEPLDLGVLKTVKSDAKRKMLTADDNVRRGRELVDALGVSLGDGTRLVCSESFSHPRNSSAAAKLSLSWGIFIAHVHLRDLPLLQASPQEVKLAVCKTKDASKQDIQDALIARYPGADLLGKLDARKQNTKEHREHAFDALATIVTCLNSEIVRMLRAGLT